MAISTVVTVKMNLQRIVAADGRITDGGTDANETIPITVEVRGFNE
jgi:ATP-dependent protease HslVU (ClpYQ) peptidase subunit